MSQPRHNGKFAAKAASADLARSSVDLMLGSNTPTEPLPPAKPYIVVKCLLADAEGAANDAWTDGYELAGFSTHQVGSGFGSYIEAMMIFKLRPSDEA
jgi:hypothetical protein